MGDHSAEILEAIREIRKLLELLAEPAIAQRDAKLRKGLRKIVGSSKPKQKSIFLMNGKHTQSEIRAETSINQGNLSTLISKLTHEKLLKGEPKLPNLVISIPTNFFESDAETD